MGDFIAWLKLLVGLIELDSQKKTHIYGQSQSKHYELTR